MRKLLFSMLSILLIIASSLAQDNIGNDQILRNNLKFSPVQFGKSYFEIGYEHFSKDFKHSFQIAPTIMLKRNSYEEFEGIQLDAQYRIYLKNLNSGEVDTWIFSNIRLFTGAYALGSTYNEDYFQGYYNQNQNYVEGQFNKKVKSGEGGVFVGLQLVVTSRVVLDFLAGGGVRYSDVVDTYENFGGEDFSRHYYDVFDIEYTGVKPRLNIQLGVSF